MGPLHMCIGGIGLLRGRMWVGWRGSWGVQRCLLGVQRCLLGVWIKLLGVDVGLLRVGVWIVFSCLGLGVWVHLLDFIFYSPFRGFYINYYIHNVIN